VGSLALAGPAPDAADLSRRWRTLLGAAREVVAQLPAEESGKCVLDQEGRLFKGDSPALREALAAASIAFHPGRIRGALPSIIGA